MKILLATIASLLLTGAGWGEYDRIDCLGDDEQLPVYRIHVQFASGGGHASAVVVGDGYALTAAHAVDGSPTAVSVITALGPRSASVIASDPINDLALLSVNTSGISPLAFYREQPQPNTQVWTAGFPGNNGTSFSGPVLEVKGGHLRIGAPVMSGMSGGAVVLCEEGIPYLAGIISSFNYRITRRYTEIEEGKQHVFERVVNDGTSNAPGGMMVVWFTEYAIELHKKREQEQE